MKKITIGRLAKETGIKVETIRYYEKYGLLSIPSRRTSGYREFTQKHIGQISFIKQAKTMGLTLREILKLLAYVDNKHTKNEIHEFLKLKMLDIEANIINLKENKKSLQSLISECSIKKNIYDCTLLKLLKS